MTAFYATRAQQIAGTTENQLLKFDSIKSRARYEEAVGCAPISAQAAKKLMIADVWRTYSSKEANCVFHAARFV